MNWYAVGLDVIAWPMYVLSGLVILVPVALVVLAVVLTVAIFRRRRKK